MPTKKKPKGKAAKPKQGRDVLGAGTALIDDLKPWGKNPRTIAEREVAALTAQIKELGSYKPLIVDEEGTVLGGNARYLALCALGELRAWVSVVRATTDADKLFFALSDNDQVGATERDKLRALLGDFAPEKLQAYTVDFGFGKPVADLLAEIGVLGVDDLTKKFAGAGAGEAGPENIEKIIIPFDDAGFRTAMAFLGRVMEDHDLESNTEAVLHVLDEYAVA